MAEIEPHTAPPLIDFPCEFPIKVMGETQDAFAQTIIDLIQTIVPSFNASHIEMRASSAGKYISLTCTVHVISQAQLDDVYRLISKHPLVKFAL
jgi:putative lipoic acid-binding regulatory protein